MTGQLVTATVRMVGTQATEEVMGRVVAETERTVTVEGMVLSHRESPEAVPVEVELPLTIRVPRSDVVVLG